MSDQPEIRIGESYPFYCEMFEDNVPPAKRMRNYTGQSVTVLACEITEEENVLYLVRAADGREFHAQPEELNGWDLAKGQFVGPSGVWGDPS